MAALEAPSIVVRLYPNTILLEIQPHPKLPKPNTTYVALEGEETVVDWGDDEGFGELLERLEQRTNEYIARHGKDPWSPGPQLNPRKPYGNATTSMWGGGRD